MARIASEDLVERLIDWGVDTVYGLPGDGINGIMEALRRHSDRIRFVLVHHEEAAAFMATAHAKATGKLGVCLATSGPGGIHLLNGLYDAKLDHQPVLAITGLQETSVLGSGYQQEVALDQLFADVSEYNLVVSNPAQLPGVVDLAIRTAYVRRGVAHLTIPNDVQVADAGEEPYRNVGQSEPPVSSVTVARAGAPRAEDVAKAAEVLQAAERPAILAGVGALHAQPELLRLAEALKAPVITTLPGKAAIPGDSEYAVGGIGLLGTRPGEDLIDDCDVLLMVGTNFPYTKYLPSPEKVKVVQLDADPLRIAGRLPVEVGIVADAAEGIRALLELLPVRTDTAHLEKYQTAMAGWRKDMAALADADRDPIAPQYAMALVDELADDDAILACDSGTIATWAARYWTIRAEREFYLSGTLASMACGLPYANAIQLAHPGRQVISLIGDGGFAMLMAEFRTAARYGLPITVIVNNNNSLGQILWEQMVLGFPENGVRFGEPEGDFAAWAQAVGGFGERVTDASRLPQAIAAALAFDGPALVDVVVNPDEPPLPAKIGYEQAKEFAMAFLRGQPRKAAIATTLFKDRISQLKA
ncbi:thiamine pyrophosphate-dependent enzyme [Rathayibacter sp. YIM 133350]|uniref:thiamine pyrophosphate-dependent enzyme n=1 Tax=Rathayibacter sp. YIM 133350 TaxID=3131992 RepID=UPI00307E123B